HRTRWMSAVPHTPTSNIDIPSVSPLASTHAGPYGPQARFERPYPLVERYPVLAPDRRGQGPQRRRPRLRPPAPGCQPRAEPAGEPGEWLQEVQEGRHHHALEPPDPAGRLRKGRARGAQRRLRDRGE